MLSCVAFWHISALFFAQNKTIYAMKTTEKKMNLKKMSAIALAM